MKVEDELNKSPTGWFAGGSNPTVADYMMSFGLEAAAARVPNLVGPKTKAWVDRVHERYALLLSRQNAHWHVYRNSSLIDLPSRG